MERNLANKCLMEAYRALEDSGVAVLPNYLMGDNFFTAIVDDYEYLINPISSKLYRAIGYYHVLDYDNTSKSRRDAIKTAKDIFEFCHDLQIGNYDKIDKEVLKYTAPKLSLYYRNELSKGCVVVTVSQDISSNDLLFNGDTVLGEISNKLKTLTKLIAIDNNGKGKTARWEKPVEIGRNWWRF